MERGLLWLPLLAVFIGLAWSGWNEYRKLESYKTWAIQFDRAKYDIYAVLGQKDDVLTWGKPTRNGPIQLETVSLRQVESIAFQVKGQLADLAAPPASGRATLVLKCRDRTTSHTIPFTDPALAAAWGNHLQQDLAHWTTQP